MAPKHIQLQIFIQADITIGKNLKPEKNNHIWLVMVI